MLILYSDIRLREFIKLTLIAFFVDNKDIALIGVERLRRQDLKHFELRINNLNSKGPALSQTVQHLCT